MRGKRILVAFLALTMLCVFALPGWAESTTVDNGDGTETITQIEEDGTRFVIRADKATNNPLNQTIYYPDGRQETTDFSYPAEGGHETVTRDAQGNVIGGSVSLPDGSGSYWGLWPDGTKVESIRDADYKTTQEKFTYPDGRQETTDYSYPAEGGQESVTRDGQGNVIGESVSLPDGSGSDWRFWSDGTKVESIRDTDYKTTQEKFTYPDGRQETTDYSYPAEGGQKSVTRDGQGNVIGEAVSLPDGSISEWRLREDGAKEETIRDTDYNTTQKKVTFIDGRQETTNYSYPAEGGLESVTRDAQGNEIRGSVTLPDGSGSEWRLREDGAKVESIRDADYKTTQEKFTYPDGRQETTDYSYPAEGGQESVTRDAQGNVIAESVRLPDRSGTEWLFRPDGTKVESTYGAGGKVIQNKNTSTDGRQEITDYVYPAEGGLESVTRDAQGNEIRGSVILPDGSGSDWWLWPDGIKGERLHDPDFNTTQETYTFPDGRQETTSYDQDGGYRKTDADGNLLAERKIGADGGSVTTRFLPNGSVRQRIEDEKGELVSDVTTAPDGRIVAESKLVDGVEHNYYYSPDGTMNEYWSDENEWHAVLSEAWGGSIHYIDFLDDEGKSQKSETWYGDTLHSVTSYEYNAAGQLILEKTEDAKGGLMEQTVISYDDQGYILSNQTFDAEGRKIRERVYSEPSQDPDTFSKNVLFDEEGGASWSARKEDGSWEKTLEKPDGTVIQTISMYTDPEGDSPTGKIEEYVNGKLTSAKTYAYEKIADADGREVWVKSGSVTRNAEGAVVGTEEFTYGENGFIESHTEIKNGQVILQETFNEKGWQLTGIYKYEDGTSSDFEMKPELKLSRERKYDAKGNLVEVIVRDQHGNVVDPSLFEEDEVEEEPKPVWYPSNTVSTHGFAFRDLRPELTKKWYRFTPVDLSKDGEIAIPLVGSNKYIIGQVKVNVTGDEVTVNYRMFGDRNDTARRESEFFTFLPDLASVTTVEPGELGEGFTFGEPVSIEKDLKGDTRVLLYVRNVATYCDHLDYDTQLGRYWPNSKNYAKYYDYLRSIMD